MDKQLSDVVRLTPPLDKEALVAIWADQGASVLFPSHGKGDGGDGHLPVWRTREMEGGLVLFTGPLNIRNPQGDGDIPGLCWCWQRNGQWAGRGMVASLEWFVEHGPQDDIFAEAIRIRSVTSAAASPYLTHTAETMQAAPVPVPPAEVAAAEVASDVVAPAETSSDTSACVLSPQHSPAQIAENVTRETRIDTMQTIAPTTTATEIPPATAPGKLARIWNILTAGEEASTPTMTNRAQRATVEAGQEGGHEAVLKGALAKMTAAWDEALEAVRLSTAENSRMQEELNSLRESANANINKSMQEADAMRRRLADKEEETKVAEQAHLGAVSQLQQAVAGKEKDINVMRTQSDAMLAYTNQRLTDMQLSHESAMNALRSEMERKTSEAQQLQKEAQAALSEAGQVRAIAESKMADAEKIKSLAEARISEYLKENKRLRYELNRLEQDAFLTRKQMDDLLEQQATVTFSELGTQLMPKRETATNNPVASAEPAAVEQQDIPLGR